MSATGILLSLVGIWIIINAVNGNLPNVVKGGLSIGLIKPSSSNTSTTKSPSGTTFLS